MNHKDSIEELFRNAVEENSPQDKPRDIVWQKIEIGLKENKTEKPLNDFIQSVWSSAAVFALIAVPYFYFLIENMNEGEKPIEIVKESVDEMLEKVPVIVQQTKHPSIIDPEIQIVKKSTAPTVSKNSSESGLKETISPSSEIVMMNNTVIAEDFSINQPIKDTVKLMAVSAKSSETTSSERKNLDSLAATSVAMAKNDSKDLEKRFVAAPVAASVNAQKALDPIVFNRNRIVLQTKVDRVSLMYVKKQNNKVIFEKDNKRFTITRKNGQVELSTNSDKFKKDLLQILINNKEHIFNYYINIPAPK